MKHCKLTALILAAAVCAACSEPERADGGPNPQTTRVTLRREGAADVAVYAFRRQGDPGSSSTRSSAKDGPPTAGCRCACRTDSTNSSSQAERPTGSSSHPNRSHGQTAWEEVHFALRENAEAPGTCCPADELFLQYPASDADAIHTVGGADLTVAATLRRAVCRIEVSVKRGYHDGTQYVEVPYAEPQSVLGEIDRIELSAGAAGLRVTRPEAAGRPPWRRHSRRRIMRS